MTRMQETELERITGLKVGDRVIKSGGDYAFEGTVVTAFQKLGGAVRLVVEDERGLLLIHSANTVKRLPDPSALISDTIGKQLTRLLMNASPFSGDVCTHCGALAMQRSGTCLTCQACGTSTGCG